jgi:hypothetical protein
MPTPNIVLVGVRLLLDRVVNNQHPGLGLHFPDERLDGPPQRVRGFLRACQVEAGYDRGMISSARNIPRRSSKNAPSWIRPRIGGSEERNRAAIFSVERRA